MPTFLNYGVGLLTLLILILQVIRHFDFSDVKKDLREILVDTRTINGRIRSLEQWRTDHERSDDTRHDEVDRRLDRLERSQDA